MGFSKAEEFEGLLKEVWDGLRGLLR